jgi:CheY-like chemotaxis protein
MYRCVGELTRSVERTLEGSAMSDKDETKTPEEPRDPAAAREAALEGRTVLVVDDEEIARSVNRWMLEKAGCQVLSTRDGKAAVQLLRGAPQAVDAVVLDLTMPRMDGIETLRELRSIRGEIPVLLSSGRSRAELAPELAGSRSVGFLQKPYEASRLIEELQRLLPDA